VVSDFSGYSLVRADRDASSVKSGAEIPTLETRNRDRPEM
jgi:glutamine synthetase type III